MRKSVLFIIGTFTSFIGAIFAIQMADPNGLQGKFEYDVWAPIYGLLIVAVLFALLLFLDLCREPTPTKRRRVEARNAVPATSWITGKPPSREWSLD